MAKDSPLMVILLEEKLKIMKYWQMAKIVRYKLYKMLKSFVKLLKDLLLSLTLIPPNKVQLLKSIIIVLAKGMLKW